MSISSFSIYEDIGNQSFQLIFNFWYIILLFIVFAIVLWQLYPLKYRHKKELKFIPGSLLFLLTVALLVLGIRGGIQSRPLQVLNAFEKGDKIGNLTLNTSFNVLMSLDKDEIERISYYSENELRNHLPVSHFNDSINYEAQNIVLIILESFGAEYIGHLNNGKGYTPFLDSLAYEGLFFNNAFANSATSVQAISSILSGIPNLMDMPIAFSAYQNVNLFNPVDQLKKKGYGAYFFHGGDNGTMNFDSYTRKMGFEYFGRNEYPNDEHYDGTWGIYDEEYLAYFCESLDQKETPFFATVFTLSSHQPYSIPDRYEGKFPKGTHPIHEVVGYTDHALKKFFEKVRKSPWYNNTLFVLTADHTHLKLEKSYQNLPGQYNIPLVLYHPEYRLPEVNTTKIVQQTDLLATLLDYLGLSPSGTPVFSDSMFNLESDDEAIFYIQGSYFLLKPSYYLRFYEDQFLWHDWKDQRFPERQIEAKDKARLKAYIQYFNNNLLDNSFYESE